MKLLKKAFAVAVAFCFLAMLAPPSRATYRLSLTGAVDFQGEPWSAQNFSGYVVVGLGEESQSQLDVVLSVSGDVAPWLNWTDSRSFAIFPGQQRFVHYTILFPACAPDEYTGLISASGSPTPGSQTGGAAIPGNVGLAIGVSIDVPARIYFAMVSADGGGALSEVANYLSQTFNGTVVYNWTQASTWIETQNRTISNLTANSTRTTNVSWASAAQLGVVYTVTFSLFDTNDTLVDEKTYGFRLPTPADIIAVWHLPAVVYADYDATVYAAVYQSQGGQTGCTCHYVIDGGSEQTGPMTYDSQNDVYLFMIDNTSYVAGSVVEYWVTSRNDASGTLYTGTSEHLTFRVFSNTAPDLILTQTDIVMIPDPLTHDVNDTGVVNIFVTVRNGGRGTASNIGLEIFDFNVSVHRETIQVLAGDGSSDTIRYSWQPAMGTHVLRFVADPDDAIIETDENNNYYSVEVSISEGPPPAEPESDLWGALPYVLIPIVILIVLLLLLFLRRKKGIRVKVLEAREFTVPRDGSTRWQYTCGYGEDKTIGIAETTDIRAKVGSVILVKPQRLFEKDDGSLAWEKAKVMKVLEKGEPDEEPDIRKLVKVEDKE
jgi:hypothetical protein